MNKLDQLLEERGLKLEDLQGEAKEQYFEWLNMLETQPLSIEDMKSYLSAEKVKIELSLTEEPEFKYHFFGLFKRENRKHLFLKARLRNYLLLEQFLQSPETKKKAIEGYLDRLIKMPKRVI